MRTLADPTNALVDSLATLRAEFRVPAAFPPAVLAEAERAAARRPDAHVDWTDRPFVTLDPATSTDLDQAFAIEAAGADLLLHYAIADVGWFVESGSALDTEAWARGETLYLPDGKASLYPPALGEGAASLLPDGPRPAVVFSVRVAPDGAARLDAATRAIVRSRAKLAYDRVRPEDLPAGFAEVAARIGAAEARRGASRVDPPEQQVEPAPGGGYRLTFRPILPSERANAALSLATNLAVADALFAHGTGLFRTMAEPNAGAVLHLRRQAAALGVAWPDVEPLAALQRRLDAARPPEAALMLAIRRAGTGAVYQPFHPGETPWHAALAATYAQATAPLRRLADRFVVEGALAVANGRAIPPALADAYKRLPRVMARADARGGTIDRAVIDLAEAATLADRIGERFGATVIEADERGARVQLHDVAVVARVPGLGGVAGDALTVRLVAAEVEARRVMFEPD